MHAAAAAPLGSYGWTATSGGRLTAAERRSLLAPLARTHLVNAAGRLAMAARVHPGRRAVVDPAALVPPSTVLTRVAEDRACGELPPMLLNHSYRTYAFGMAVAAVEGIDVDRELLFVAAMLHDLGLAGRPGYVDFSLAGARAARDVAESVGLSSAATDTVRDAITLHHNPGVTREHGAVAYLLAAGAGLDVAGLRSWKVPASVLARTVQERPRLAFKRGFDAAWRAEADAVPAGRARFLRRYGAFSLAIRLAPFDE